MFVYDQNIFIIIKTRPMKKKIYAEVVNYDEVKLSFNDVLYVYYIL